MAGSRAHAVLYITWGLLEVSSCHMNFKVKLHGVSLMSCVVVVGPKSEAIQKYFLPKQSITPHLNKF